MLIYRRFHGMFSTPDFLFPTKCWPADSIEVAKYSPLIQGGDQLSNKVTVKGTNYLAGQILVTKAYSYDELQVGTIIHVVLRKNTLMFLVHLSESVRNNMGFFEALPTNTVDLIQYDMLADYKPLVKRGQNRCFPFVLHHHVPPPFDDGSFV
jgi:hypothetical protein